MTCRQSIRVFVMIGIGGLATACVAPGPESGSVAQEIGSGSDEAPGAAECSLSCSLSLRGGYIEPVQQRLECSETYDYLTDDGAFPGGFGSFCDDTPKNRSQLRTEHVRAYTSDHDVPCLPIPAGKLFVFWVESQGPGCPSSCVDPPGFL